MHQIFVAELTERLKEDPSVQLLDVREPYEHEEYNIGGTNIPLATIPLHLEEIQAMAEKGDIVLYCRSGNRSGMAQKLLSMHAGILNTYNLIGGMMAWQEHHQEH